MGVRNGFVVQTKCGQVHLKTLESTMPRNGWIARSCKEQSRQWQLITSHLVSHPRRQNSKKGNLRSAQIQDNLRHINYTQVKYSVRRLKYRLDISIRNYIFTSMPYPDSYTTAYTCTSCHARFCSCLKNTFSSFSD